MDPEFKENVSSTNTWGRVLFMLLFGVIYSVAEIVLVTVVVIQFFFVLFTGDANQRLLQFGKELSRFIYQVFIYLTFNSEDKPFPFSPWPAEPAQGAEEGGYDESGFDEDELDEEEHGGNLVGPSDKP